MANIPTVLVYKKRNRDIETLERACVEFGFLLNICETDDELLKEIMSGTIDVIIVPLGSQKEGYKNAAEFAVALEKILQPEDPDMLILYSTEEYTPENWHGEPDPRLTRVFGENEEPQIVPDDKQWKHTIQKLQKLQKLRLQLKLQRNPLQRTLTFDFSLVDSLNETWPKKVPFPTEVEVLLRSAFKDMCRITISFPKQGLSGSLAFMVQPYDQHERKCKQLFVKVYPETSKALLEFTNFLTYVQNYLDSDCYTTYLDNRRYQGKAYSLFVTELVGSSSDTFGTYQDLFHSRYSTAKKIKSLTLNALNKMDKGWQLMLSETPIDLINEYLKNTLEDTVRLEKLNSENTFNKWFGNCADGLTLEQKIRISLPSNLLLGTRTKICHGDLHTDNLMVKKLPGKLMPIFIDFSRTRETHSLKDLVTIESDLVIRGLDSIKEFKSREGVRFFLKSIPSYNSNRIPSKSPSLKWKKQAYKVFVVINELRKNARKIHMAPEAEYLVAALLKTLEILSYGRLPREYNERAVEYINFLIYRIKQLGN